MTEATEKLPPNLKRLAELIGENQPAAEAHPALKDLFAELEEVGNDLYRAGVSFGAGKTKSSGGGDESKEGLNDALGIVFRPGGSGGGGKVKCPECGHRFTPK